MKKLFVCLANSWKTGGRCVAGIEVQQAGGTFNVVRVGAEPLWIRPISATKRGEIPERAVQGFHLLDILEIDCIEHVPDGAQRENWRFHGSLTKVGEYPCNAASLDQLLSSPRMALFGNHGKAVHVDHIAELDHSLLFLRAEGARTHIRRTSRGKNQLRLVFVSSGFEYDLAVTDPVSDQVLRRNPGLLAQADLVYLTLSLGQEKDDFHTKLIAGIVFC